MRTRYIYITENKINEKKYIGQRLCPVGVDVYDDYYFGSGTLICKALKKYGGSNFLKYILAVCHSQKIADCIEKYFIDFYGANKDRSKWYNIDCGGQYDRDDEHSKITARAMKDYHSTPENRCASLAKRFNVSYEEYRLYINRKHLINTIKKYRTAKKKQEAIFKKINKQIANAHKPKYWETEEGIRKRKLLSEKQKSDPAFKKKVQDGKDKRMKEHPNFYSRERSIEERIKQARSKLDPKNIMHLHNYIWDSGNTIMMIPDIVRFRINGYLKGYRSERGLRERVLFISEQLNEIGIKHDVTILIEEAYNKLYSRRKNEDSKLL